jgi:hypothetical protein
VGQHGSASASRLLGLDGFQVVSAELVGGEWQLAVQTTATVIGGVGCGGWAAAIRPRAVLTERARAEACRRVGVKLGDAHDLVRALPGQPRACPWHPWHAPGLRRPTGACAADGIPANPGMAAL